MEMFDAKYIDAELEKIGARVKTPLSIYLIGGCAMSFRDLKEATKDADILFKTRADCANFCGALFGAQYFEPLTIIDEYRRLDALKMFENKDKFHLDLFVKKVCRKMRLTESMSKRAEPYKKYGKMDVLLVSKEDIFLFKSLASEGRRRDLDDMRAIYPNLDWAAMLEELTIQDLSTNLVRHMIGRLEDFHKTYDLDVPILGKMKKHVAAGKSRK